MRLLNAIKRMFLPSKVTYIRSMILNDLIKNKNLKRVVELGAYDDNNLIYLTRNNRNVSFYGVDLWTHFDSEKIVKSPEK